MGKLFKRLFFGVFTVAAMVVTLSAISVSAKAQANESSDININVTYSVVNGQNLGQDQVISLKNPATGSQKGFDALLKGYGVNDLAVITLYQDPTKVTGVDDPIKKAVYIINPAEETMTAYTEYVSGNPDWQEIHSNEMDGRTPGEYAANIIAKIPFIGFGHVPEVEANQINNNQDFGNLRAMTGIDIMYLPVHATANVKYVNEANNQTVKSYSISGYLAETGTYTPVAPSGYKLINSSSIPYTLTKDDSDDLTVSVVPISTPVTPSPDSNNNTPTVTPQKNDSWNPTNSNKNATGEPAVPNYAAVKGAAVYATNHIYMYKNATFAKSQRIAKYPKAKRVDRPMFVVTDYARSKAGALRYKVRDVNHGSKTAGKVGYITANRKFVVPVYYKSVPKNNKITIISKRGVHAYRNVNLTKYVKHYKKGVRLTVKRVVKHNLTTRYQLTNGNYVTANKKLVIQGNY